MKPLGLLLLFSGAVLASPILVGPIGLTGSGTLAAPDCTSYGAECFGGRQMTINASGSSNGHTVSINSGVIPLFSGLDNPPAIGTNLVFVAALSCAHPFAFGGIVDHCGVTIDGISAYSLFDNIGGGNGLLQVWSMPDGGGDLLAEAQIISYVTITSNFNPCPPVCIGGNIGEPSHWSATFDVNPTPTPEPGTWLMGVPLTFIFFRRISVSSPR